MIIKPNFFIVGAPKCATSALYTHLRLHPEIFMAYPKELNYFSMDLTSPDFIHDEEKYLPLFSDAGDAKSIGEASVWYMYSKVAASKIREFSPDAKIIAMLRNPVEMIYSYHSQRIWNGTEDLTDFGEAIDAIEDRRNGKRLPEEPYPVEGLYYLDLAKYYDQIKRYIDAFGRDNVKIIIFDDFKNDTDTILRETQEFLGVDPDYTADIPDTGLSRNSNRRTRNTAISNFLQNPPGIILKAGKLLLPSDELREKLWRKLRIMNTTWVKRNPIDEALKGKLENYYKEENKKLSDLLGRDLTRLWS